MSLQRLFKVALILGFAAAATHGATSKYRLTWRDNPATTMVVAWVQNSGINPVVRYGESDNGAVCADYPDTKAPDRSTSQSGMNHHFARLTGLTPNTAYYFVVCDSEGSSSRMWFKTAPNSADVPFTVIAGGDSRNKSVPRRNANLLVAKLRPLFVMFGGDMTNKGYDREWQQWFDDWQLTKSMDGRMYPVLASRGNHEGSNAIIDNMFDVPNSSIYYALNVGGNLMRVYTLNTQISIAGEQTSWLTSDLAENDAVTWKLVQYHKPMRPHVAAKSEGNAQYKYWAQPFQNHRISLVVECDAHTVKHTWPVIPSTASGSDEGFLRNDEIGTVYVGEGCWGAPLRKNDDNKVWTRNSAKFNSFHWVHVHGTHQMELRTVNVDNAKQVVSKSEDENPFTSPSGLNVWSPSNGAAVIMYPIPASGDSKPVVASQRGSLGN